MTTRHAKIILIILAFLSLEAVGIASIMKMQHDEEAQRSRWIATLIDMIQHIN